PNIFTLDVPAIEWMVDGILPRASVTLLAGEPGSYKTWLALALLRGVASGGNFLGRKCAQSSVLYLDRENPLAVMRARLAVLGIEQSATADCRIWGGWLDNAPPGIGDFRILEIARERRPLIVFDSLIRFHAAADENSATEMSMVMADLRALANAGATVVVLHHKPKSEGSHYRGSSDIAGGVDTALAVSRDRGAGLLRLECFKSRFAEEFSLTLRPELSGVGSAGDFVVTDSPEASTEQSDVEKLAETIRRNPGQPKERVVQTSGVALRRGRWLLERFNGQLWYSKPGGHNAMHFFPGPEATTDELDN
ncbi:MAG TPA: AAA family ATPase, partial [Candidatus Acidoferrales bacterium]